jgi:hypothetical protein
MFNKIALIAILIISLLLGCSPNKDTSTTNDDWQVSPFFQVGHYQMIGQEGKLGFIYAPFKANVGQKYMWHFWGEEMELKGNFHVVATSKETGEEITVFQVNTLSGPNNGAEAHTPSTMMLPTVGLWKLDAYIGGNLFGTIVIEVEE